MKRVLLISYYFPPSGGPGVQRILKFVRYLPQCGWLPTVLTVDPNYAAFPSIDDSLLEEIPSDVEVIRTRAWDPFSVYARIQGKRKDEVIKVGYIEGKQGLKNVARWLRGNIFLPDARVGWVPFGSRAARKLVQKQKFDAVISTGPPHSSHLIGMAAHKASGLPWVVDMRDPWVEIYYRDQMYEGAIAKRIQAHLERKVLSTASTVISVSRHLGVGFKRRVHMQHYETIPNGYDPADIPLGATPVKEGDTLVIGYVGTYSLRTHSEGFVAALQQLQLHVPVEVHLVGKVDSEALEAYRAKGIPVKGVPYLSHGKAISYMQSVDILLLALPRAYGDSAEGIVSGKAFEYISARRPILAIGPTEGDLADLLNQTQSGNIFDHDDREGILGFLNDHLEFRGKPWKINDEALAEYERPRLASKLARLLDRLTVLHNQIH